MKDPRNTRELTHALAQALGLPHGTSKAVLTLERGKAPTLDVTMFAKDSRGEFVIEAFPHDVDMPVERRIAQVQFMLQLAPFKPTGDAA